jgi:hypothetical protein
MGFSFLALISVSVGVGAKIIMAFFTIFYDKKGAVPSPTPINRD